MLSAHSILPISNQANCMSQLSINKSIPFWFELQDEYLNGLLKEAYRRNLDLQLAQKKLKCALSPQEKMIAKQELRQTWSEVASSIIYTYVNIRGQLDIRAYLSKMVTDEHRILLDKKDKVNVGLDNLSPLLDQESKYKSYLIELEEIESHIANELSQLTELLHMPPNSLKHSFFCENRNRKEISCLNIANLSSPKDRPDLLLNRLAFCLESTYENKIALLKKSSEVIHDANIAKKNFYTSKAIFSLNSAMLETAREKEKLSQDLYNQGLESEEILLASKEAYYLVQKNYIASKIAFIQSFVAFYKAFGTHF